MAGIKMQSPAIAIRFLIDQSEKLVDATTPASWLAGAVVFGAGGVWKLGIGKGVVAPISVSISEVWISTRPELRTSTSIETSTGSRENGGGVGGGAFTPSVPHSHPGCYLRHLSVSEENSEEISLAVRGGEIVDASLYGFAAASRGERFPTTFLHKKAFMITSAGGGRTAPRGSAGRNTGEPKAKEDADRCRTRRTEREYGWKKEASSAPWSGISQARLV
jgi:hypothetical protein